MNVIIDSYTHRPLEVVATAARTCYSADFPENIDLSYEQQVKLVRQTIKSGHLSVLEHANFTFHISGVSRALLAQITRHRIASFSVESQRYVNMGSEPDVVYPPSIMKDENLSMHFDQLMKDIWAMYDYLISEGVPAEDARFVLPNACTTNLVMTMNARELLHFFELRCCNRCYDADTDILTKNGWKNVKELEMNDEYYSINRQGFVEFVKAKNLIKEDFTGNMIRTKAQSVDLLTTPDHKMYASKSYDYKNFKLISTEDAIKAKTLLMKKNCNSIEGEKKDEIEFDNIKYDTDELMYMLGVYLGDGWSTKAGYHFNIGISEGNQTIAEDYMKHLSKISKNKPMLQKDGTAFKITLHDKGLYKLFWGLGEAKNKRFPSWVWNLDHTHLRQLYNGLMSSDGTKRVNGNSYSTISKDLANDFQRLLLHIGYSGKLSVIDRVGKSHSVGKRNIENKCLEYRISVNENKNEPIIKTNIRNPFHTEHYDGKVYCVELEKNHTLMVRRNGCMVWSGNSQWEIRGMAYKMLEECKRVCPEIFEFAGPKCWTSKCTEAKPCGNPPHKPKNDIKEEN